MTKICKQIVNDNQIESNVPRKNVKFINKSVTHSKLKDYNLSWEINIRNDSNVLSSINLQAAKNFSLNKSTLEAEVASKIIITDSIIMTPALCLMLRLCHCLKLCGQKVSITGVSLRVCLLIL